MTRSSAISQGTPERTFFCTAKVRERGGNRSAGEHLFLLITFYFRAKTGNFLQQICCG